MHPPLETAAKIWALFAVGVGRVEFCRGRRRGGVRDGVKVCRRAHGVKASLGARALAVGGEVLQDGFDAAVVLAGI